VVGGYNNVINAPTGTGADAIVGGFLNTISESSSISMVGCRECQNIGDSVNNSYYNGLVGAFQNALTYVRWAGVIGTRSCTITGTSGAPVNYVGMLGCYNCSITANTCAIIGGDSNSISANGSVILGGYNNTITAQYGLASGRDAVVSGVFGSANGAYCIASRYGQQSKASGRFVSTGDAQVSTLIARRRTTTATPTELFLDGSSARLTVPEGATYGFTIKVVARQTNDDFSIARYVFEGVATRDTGGNVSVQVTKTYEYEDDSDWGCAVDADTANQTIRITVTGKAGNDINWVARIETEETFA
jgi:hypothetical protein